MKSARLILLDLLVYFIVNSYFLAVNYFFYSLAVFVLAGNFRFYSNLIVVVFLFYSQRDQTFSDLADLFCLCLCCNDLSVI